jgi:hypothetical protein
MTLMLKRGVLLKSSVLLKSGRNRPALDLASRQDARYKGGRDTASTQLHPGLSVELSWRGGL